jgi:hypothetical protein
MIDVTKFVVAGALVAVFGGFMTAGDRQGKPSDGSLTAASTASLPPTASATAVPEAMSRADLLPGLVLVTEEVEPGVLRVVRDGVRDLSRPSPGPDDDPWSTSSNVMAGLDGSVWIFRPDVFYRVGDELSHPSGTEIVGDLGQKIMADPAGVLWTIPGDTLSLVSFDEGAWTTRKEGVTAFDLQPDGTVWVVGGSTLERLEESGWVEAGVTQGWVSDLRVSPVIHEFFTRGYERPDAEVEVVLLVSGRGGELDHLGLFGPNGASYGPAGALPAKIIGLDMDARGDYWILQSLDIPLAGPGFADEYPESETVTYLVHVAGGPRTVFAGQEGVPLPSSPSALRAAPDGAVWMNTGTEWSYGNAMCDGIARFDGTTWERYLRGSCVYAFDVAPDGAVWLQAGDWDAGADPGPIHTYVITPTAVAAPE